MINNMTSRQREIIADNVRAFVHNFGPVRIEHDTVYGFYVYYPADSDSYMFYAPDIHTIDGWLYGAVQGVLRVKPIADKAMR